MKRNLFFVIISILVILSISGCNKPKIYTVTFDANGGTGTMAPQTFTEGEVQALTRNSFANSGYSFAGWNTFASGIGMNYSDEQIIIAVEDMTLYAQWELLIPDKGELNGLSLRPVCQ